MGKIVIKMIITAHSTLDVNLDLPTLMCYTLKNLAWYFWGFNFDSGYFFLGGGEVCCKTYM